MKKSVSFKEALASLSASSIPAPRQLRGLNNLDGAQLDELQAAWPLLDAERRSYVAEKLREMAVDELELDFTPIFLFGLSDVEESVRLSSLEGLWEYENPNLLDLLAVLVRSDPSTLVRAASATAIGRFLFLGELDKINRRRRDQAYSALMGALLTSEPGTVVYLHALEALGYVSNEEMDRLIREAYASDNPAMRMTAVIAMGRSSDKQYSKMVRHELLGVLPAMRAEAARASGELDIAEAIPDLGKLLEDTNPEVVIAAIEALGLIGGDDATRLLETVSESEDEEIAAAAADALEEAKILQGDIKFSTMWVDELGGGQTGDHAGGHDEE